MTEIDQLLRIRGTTTFTFCFSLDGNDRTAIALGVVIANICDTCLESVRSLALRMTDLVIDTGFLGIGEDERVRHKQI